MTLSNQPDDDLIEGVRRFVEREVLGKVQALEAADTPPSHLIQALADIGLFGAAVPVEFGGLAINVPTYARVMEELAYGWTALNCYLNSHFSAASMITRYGTDAQRRRFLPRMATGELRVAIALTEPNGGSDLQAIRTRAVRTAGGAWHLSGNKIFITNGGSSGAVVVLTRTGEGKNGFSLFIVEKGLPGFSVGGRAKTMAHRHIDVSELNFEAVELSDAELIGGVPGNGLQQMLDAIETGRIAMGATAVGLARSALQSALDYAAQRHSFGQAIGNHQAVQGLLADMGSKTLAARALVQEAALAKARGGRADMVAGMAKLFAGEVCAEVALNCVRIHGGSGWVSDFPAERYYREAPYFVLVEGSNEIQKTIIARRLLAGDGQSVGL
jgi:alkylation response protein AidB-like acyl-CoA dehydrogenase